MMFLVGSLFGAGIACVVIGVLMLVAAPPTPPPPSWRSPEYLARLDRIRSTPWAGTARPT